MQDSLNDSVNYRPSTEEVAETARDWLARRGVTITQIAQLTFMLQKDYYPGLTLEECEKNVEAVLKKREVQNALLTGIQLDMLAEEGKLMQPLLNIVRNDEGLYGCDEVLALSIVNVYGSIGLTNFGYMDKVKPAIIKRLNSKKGSEVHTFLDDIVGAIAAAAASRMAHNYSNGEKD
jgi:phosphatidylglycerophosphatase A